MFGHLNVTTGKHLICGEPGQAAVVMIEVVPIKVLIALGSGMSDTVKAARIIGLVLLGFKLAFTERVVVGLL